MAKEFDFSQFEKFAENWQKMDDNFDEFLKKFLLEMANRLLAKVKPRTPVDTGAMRAMWQIGEIRASGRDLEVEILNGMEYASFVEYGARNVNGTWRDGRFMLTISIDEVQKALPARFDKAFRAFLQGAGAI